MNFKLFNMTWDLKPVFIFIWMMVGIGLFCGLLQCGFSDNPLGFFGFFLADAMWAYICHTLVDNGCI